ncbi:LysE/ArgO family amino acid transporter [Dongshaea marina]|uniref:LysE/ArgO family amino acid transporter n=1 Tax=Dongshaea marina TaxID=2047966 RepID=UPI000D3ED49A|nr:LysE/ArgO family amino acid transporter [Dongshaea marina]
MFFSLLAQGFGLGIAMILPIGAQNAYLLNLGLKKRHHLLSASLCSLCDLGLITLGVFGMGQVFGSNPALLMTITLAGIAFLCGYALLSLKSAVKPALESGTSGQLSNKKWQAVILGTLAVTLLNPQVYLDTLVIFGSVGAQFNLEQKVAFTLGSVIASIVWFFSLATIAARLSSILSKPITRRIIDILVALIMLVIAGTLAMRLFN